jgi:hypothetical protein
MRRQHMCCLIIRNTSVWRSQHHQARRIREGLGCERGSSDGGQFAVRCVESTNIGTLVEGTVRLPAHLWQDRGLIMGRTSNDAAALTRRQTHAPDATRAARYFGADSLLL